MKVANKQSKCRNPKSLGWQRRDERTFDAALVTVIDFERAMAALNTEEQVALVFRYRDGISDERMALALGCSVRKVSYLIPTARRRLASILDRLDLL
jgi:DNA-directed RNA polymerase specialized sigma24 family protein